MSKAVTALEARLGARLLDRTTRRVSPTEAGQIFYERCRRALDEAQAGVAEVMARQETPVGHLRIGAPEGFAERCVIPALAGFLEANPQITVEVVESVEMTGPVENRLDLSIRVVREPDGSLIVRRLGTSPVIACASPRFVERQGTPERAEDIARFPVIGFSPLFWSREWRVRRGEDMLSIPVSPILSVNSAAALRAALLSDIGITALPIWAIADEIARGRLIRVLGHETLPESGDGASRAGAKILQWSSAVTRRRRSRRQKNDSERPPRGFFMIRTAHPLFLSAATAGTVRPSPTCGAPHRQIAALAIGRSTVPASSFRPSTTLEVA